MFIKPWKLVTVILLSMLFCMLDTFLNNKGNKSRKHSEDTICQNVFYLIKTESLISQDECADTIATHIPRHYFHLSETQLNWE